MTTFYWLVSIGQVVWDESGLKCLNDEYYKFRDGLMEGLSTEQIDRVVATHLIFN